MPGMSGMPEGAMPGMPGMPGGMVVGGAMPGMPEGAMPGMPAGAVAMGGMEGMPAGAVAVGGMPDMPQGEDTPFSIEYRFERPIRYSGYRMEATESGMMENDPKDYQIYVDVMDMEGVRGEENLLIQSMTNADE